MTQSAAGASKIPVKIDEECSLTLDGTDAAISPAQGNLGIRAANDWVYTADTDEAKQWIVGRAHWRVHLSVPSADEEEVRITLQAVRIEAYTGEKVRNGGRGFLNKG